MTTNNWPEECAVLGRAELVNLRAARENMLKQLQVIEEWIADVEAKLLKHEQK